MDIEEARELSAVGLCRLLAWLSPAYPIGSFSYSHGLETAIEEGLVGDRATLIAWVDGVLRHGTGRIDGAIFAAAWSAMMGGDDAALAGIADLAAAWRGTAEMALESRQQGASFLAVTQAAWPHPALESFAARQGGECALSVAVAVAAAAHGIAVRPALAGYLHAFAGNLVSAAVRIVPLGQTDGQRAVAALGDAVAHALDAALTVGSLDDVGGATPMLDWCSMRHETQYTRLFRS